MEAATARRPVTAGFAGNADVLIMGAGPAGLTAAWELSRNGRDVTVLEADPHKVGGIAQTASYKGFRFDIGGHRFFTKAAEIHRIWHEILDPEDWLERPRMSRIYFDGKFFDYPLRAFDALAKLGVGNAALCLGSYARARAFPRSEERSFEDWIVNRFGQRLYRTFFKSYTEKVWGMPCAEISADWAAQRIKGLSLVEAVRNGLRSPGSQTTGRDGEVIKTLIDRFAYPRHGPGMLWERAAAQVAARGGRVHMGTPVSAIRHCAGRVVEVVGNGSAHRADEFISTLPIRDLVRFLEPVAPPAVRTAAAALRYRDFLTVVLIVDRAEVFPDNWVYVHDPSVRLGRVQNFKNWSTDMVPDQRQTALGLEYFCTEGDGLWGAGDDELVALGTREIDHIGLAPAADVVDGTVVRMRKAYPVYDDGYQRNVAVVRDWCAANLANLQMVGRNGMHKYNNQDHSMMAALLAARNLLGEDWDPWKVNTDAEYHEEVHAADDYGGRLTPQRVPA